MFFFDESAKYKRIFLVALIESIHVLYTFGNFQNVPPLIFLKIIGSYRLNINVNETKRTG